MRTKLLLMSLLSICIETYSQSDTVVYDFSKGVYEISNIKPKRGKPVSFKIKRINPLFYEIIIKSEDKEISYQNLDIESAKKSLDEIQQNNYYKMQESFVFEESFVTLLPSSGKESSEEVKVLQQKYQGLDKLTLEIENLEKEKKDLNKIGNSDETKTVDLQAILAKDNQLLLKKKEIIDKTYEIKEIVNKSENNDVLRTDMNKRVNELNNAYQKYIKSSRRIIKLNQNYNNYIDKVISPELTYDMYRNIINNQKVNMRYKKCKDEKNDDNDCETLKNTVLPIETTFFLSKENMADAYGEFEFYTVNYQEVIDKVNKFISFLNYGTSNSSKENDILKSALIKDIERIQKSIKIADDVVQKINLSKKLNEVEILDRLLSNKETYEYASAPIQGEEDYLQFDVTIKSKRNINDSYHIDNDKSFKYFEYIKGGVRFDFSVGTVFDFGTIDKKYTLDSTNKIQRVDDNKYNPTIAGIFHASFRNSTDFAFGFSLGASFNTGLSFNSIFPGISLLMGKRNKIILTAGPSFRQVDELKTRYKEEMQLNNSIADEDLLTKNFKVGGFIGISYNLTPKQKETFKLK